MLHLMVAMWNADASIACSKSSVSRMFTALSCNSCFLPVVGRSFSAKKAFNSATVAEDGEKLLRCPDSAMFAILNRTVVHH